MLTHQRLASRTLFLSPHLSLFCPSTQLPVGVGQETGGRSRRAGPCDPFSDRPLVYRRQADGYLLYSVGANGTDDGGVAAEWADMLQGHGDLFLDGPATKADNSGVTSQSPAEEK